MTLRLLKPIMTEMQLQTAKPAWLKLVGETRLDSEDAICATTTRKQIQALRCVYHQRDDKSMIWIEN